MFACRLAAWQHASMAVWHHGSMAALQHGSIAAWQHGSMATWQLLMTFPNKSGCYHLLLSQPISQIPLTHRSDMTLLFYIVSILVKSYVISVEQKLAAFILQCCGAKIIYFRLQLHLCPLLRLQLLPYTYCHLKLYYNSSSIRNMLQWRFIFILASSKLTAVNVYSQNNYGSGSQIISAPLAPARQHWFTMWIWKTDK